MLELGYFEGYSVAVLGLGQSGLTAALSLHASGAEVWAWDDNEERRESARDRGVPIVDLSTVDFRETTTLVLSPGIPHTHPKPHPIVQRAKDAGCELISDIELMARAQRNAMYIGVTGTNGKSTTTALIGHIFELGGRTESVGGNIGVPAMELEPMGEGEFYVLEMSSYQLELPHSITFDVAVLLNISADHLDRHGGMAGCTTAKKIIFNRQTRPRTAVVGVDDPISEGIFKELSGANDQRIVPISARTRIHGGVYVQDGVLIDDTEGKEIPAMDLKDVVTLPGEHNWQNAAAAYAASTAAGMDPAVVTACIRSFPGLAHRLELVERVDGILFINDSKGTNAEATARALACYDTIFWIAGGLPKEGGIASLSPYFSRIKQAFLVGQAEDQFAATLDGHVSYSRCGTLDNAVSQAFDAATQADPGGMKGAVVLLSPACASWDQFKSFEARGDYFKSLVESLPGDHDDEL